VVAVVAVVALLAGVDRAVAAKGFLCTGRGTTITADTIPIITFLCG
jgi:hypothetical protein